VKIDADGNYWVIDYKGGDDSGLAPGQMKQAWVLTKIDDLIEYHGDLTGWGTILLNAFNAGKLRGIAVKTDYANGVVGDTYVLDTWVYGP
jgi:hypothetical protein